MSYFYSDSLPSSSCPSAGLTARAAEAAELGHGTASRDTAEIRCSPGLEGKAPGYEGPAEPRRCGESPPSVPGSLFQRTHILEPEALPRAPASLAAAGGRLEGTTERLINAGEPGLGDSGRTGSPGRSCGQQREGVSASAHPTRPWPRSPLRCPLEGRWAAGAPGAGVAPAHTGVGCIPPSRHLTLVLHPIPVQHYTRTAPTQ